jgi:hypothetical protein
MKKLFIFVVAVAFVAACVMPAMAQEKEINFYGSVRMETFARYYSKEVAERGGELDRETTVFEIGDSSRFGANFKSGNMSANVELRPQGGGAGGSSMNFRQWWGQVDFTGWQLRVGQQSVIDGLFPPGCCIDEGSVQSGFGGWGGRVRQPGLAAFIPLGNGTLKFGLFDPGTLPANTSGSAGVSFRAATPTSFERAAVAGNPALVDFKSDIDEHIPQIQVSYDIKLGPAALKFVGGYNTYDEVFWSGDGATSEVTESIDSFILGGEVQANFGPLTVMWQLHYAQNSAAYLAGGGPNSPIFMRHEYDPTSNSIQDVKEWGTFARIIYKMSDMIDWEIGGGYSDQKKDFGVGEYDDDRYFVYLNAQIFLSKTFRFTPEIGYFDNRTRSQPGVGVADVEQGSLWYWGAYWRIDF